jgi:CYTH domain-containing protein
MAGIEIERKYIIKLPSIDDMKNEAGYTVSRITQIYINSPAGVTHRVRKREYADKTVYTETRKTRIDKMSVVEDEREISEEEYLSLSKNLKIGTRPVLKTRHTFKSGENVVEIDVYPEWKKTCILETELSDRGETVSFPDFIEIVKEVTGEFEYSNASMAKSFPPEIKAE